MSAHSAKIGRRKFLRGLGVTMALPAMESMMPGGRALAKAAQGKPPVRMAFMYVPNGIHMPSWRPTREGAFFDLPYSLKPLASVRDEVSVLSGLTQDKSRANADGGGDHARAGSVFLTGSQPLKSEGAEVRVGQSIDQFAAAHQRQFTRFPSLELGTEKGRPYGKCDTGYS